MIGIIKCCVYIKLSKTHKGHRGHATESIRHRLLFSDDKTQEAEVRPMLWLAAAGAVDLRSQFPVSVLFSSVPAASVLLSTVDPSSLSWRSPEHGHSSEPRVVNCHQGFTVLWICGQKWCPEDEEDGGESVRGVRWESRPVGHSAELSELSVPSVPSDPNTIKSLIYRDVLERLLHSGSFHSRARPASCLLTTPDSIQKLLNFACLNVNSLKTSVKLPNVTLTRFLTARSTKRLHWQVSYWWVNKSCGELLVCSDRDRSFCCLPDTWTRSWTFLNGVWCGGNERQRWFRTQISAFCRLCWDYYWKNLNTCFFAWSLVRMHSKGTPDHRCCITQMGECQNWMLCVCSKRHILW